MIFVPGANGQYASAVINTILAVGPRDSPAVGTRDVNSPLAREFATQGASFRHADFRDPALTRWGGLDCACFTVLGVVIPLPKKG